MITLEKPPIKVKQTESFSGDETLEAEPVGKEPYEASPEIEDNINEVSSVKQRKSHQVKGSRL